MKITRLEPLVLITKVRIPYQFIYVRVHTDEGIVGIGECGMSPKALTIKAYIEEMEPLMLGRNPLDIEALWQFMYRQPYERAGPIIMSAIAGIDMALWDIAGKKLGVPSNRLFGGAVRHKIPLFGCVNPMEDYSDAAKLALDFKKRGFNAVRLAFPTWLVDIPVPQLIQGITDLVGTVRKAIGVEMDLAIDMHRRLRVFEAIAVAKALEPYHMVFIEDPIMPDNNDAMATVAASTSIPIATGENLYTPAQFRDLFAARGARFARVDLCLAGGITAGLKIAHLAEAEYIDIIPHHPWSPVATAGYVHYCSAIHNLLYLEYNESPEWAMFVDHQIELKDGYLFVPDRPGLGIELDEAMIRESEKLINSPDRPQLWSNPVLTRKDGTVTDW